jgi:hypothetical protein
MSLPALMLLLFAALTAVGAVRTELECVDAAREAVWAAARGDSGEEVGGRVAPAGAIVTIRVDGDTIHATVVAHVHILGAHLPGFAVRASATGIREPGSA